MESFLSATPLGQTSPAGRQGMMCEEQTRSNLLFLLHGIVLELLLATDCGDTESLLKSATAPSSGNSSQNVAVSFPFCYGILLYQPRGVFSSLQSCNLTSRNTAPDFVQRQKFLRSASVSESAGMQPQVRKHCPGKRVMKAPTLFFKQFAFFFPSRNSL